MPLSFTEKRALQKAITANLANLQGGNLSFADKRKYQKEIQDAFAKLKEKLDIPAKMSRVEWEMAVIRVIEDKADATTSDAQGIFGGQEFAVAQAWGMGLEPEAAAEKIIKAATVPIEPVADALKKLESIKQFFPEDEYQTIKGNLSGEEKDFFIQKIAEIATTIETMPKVYGQDGGGDDAVVYLHYFKGGSDWYITEKDSEAEQLQAFGYAILNGDKQNAELGYINIIELTKVGVELDLYWQPKTLGKIKGAPATEPEKKTDVSAEMKMTDAVVGYGGSITEQRPDQVSFVINDKKALIVEKDGGFKVYYGENGELISDSYINPENAVQEVHDWSKQKNQKLSDLIAGKYNNEAPAEFLRILQDIIGEINDIEPVKPPTIGYIEANKEKIGAIMESALSELFGKMWAPAMGKISEPGDRKRDQSA